MNREIEIRQLTPIEGVSAFELQRLVAQQIVGQPILHHSSGEPYIEGDSVHISISHTSGWVAVQQSDRRCGIDIELIDRNVARVASRFIRQDEERFEQPLLIWCVKEAICKLTTDRSIDFLTDIQILSIDGDQIVAMVRQTDTVELRWFVYLDKLLVAHTL